MSKTRGFWLHETVKKLITKKIPSKVYLDVLQSIGFLKFFFKNIKYWSVLRKYVYGLNIFHLCSAGPFHVANMSSKRLSFYDLMVKLGGNYLFYNYIFSKKNNYTRYKIIRPSFSVNRSSDLFLVNTSGLENLSNDLIIDSLFVDKNYSQLAENIVGEDKFHLNFFFIFSISILQILEIYKLVGILFFFKIFKSN